MLAGEGEAVKYGEMPEAEAVAVEETDQVDANNLTSSMPLLSSLFGMPRFKVHVTTGDKAGAGRQKIILLCVRKLIYCGLLLRRRIGCRFRKKQPCSFNFARCRVC